MCGSLAENNIGDKMKFLKITAFVGATLLAAPAAMAASILIDDFDTFQKVDDVPFNPGVTGEVSSSTVAAPDALGGARFMSVSTAPASVNGARLISNGIGTGFATESALEFTTGGGQVGIATVSYGLGVTGATALGNLTGGTGIGDVGTLDKFFFDLIPNTQNFDGASLTTTVVSGTGVDEETAVVTESLDAGMINPFTSFALFEADNSDIDFTNVASLTFVFQTSATLTGFDAELASISVVPLPLSALLLLGGLGGLAGASAVSKRRRQKA